MQTCILPTLCGARVKRSMVDIRIIDWEAAHSIQRHIWWAPADDDALREIYKKREDRGWVFLKRSQCIMTATTWGPCVRLMWKVTWRCVRSWLRAMMRIQGMKLTRDCCQSHQLCFPHSTRDKGHSGRQSSRVRFTPQLNCNCHSRWWSRWWFGCSGRWLGLNEAKKMDYQQPPWLRRHCK